MAISRLACQDEIVAQLSWMDAAFVRAESVTTPNHVNPVGIYDPSTALAPVTYTGILRAVESRLDAAPVFRRRLVDLPLGLSAPYLVDDDAFDIEYHIRHIALPKPGDWRQLCIQLARLHARSLDLRRPPWEMTIIEGLDGIQGLPSGCFAVSLKVHHSVIDGAEGVQLLNAIHDLSPEPRFETGDGGLAVQRVPSRPIRVTRAARSAAAYPVRTLRTVLPHLPASARALRGLLGGGLPTRTRFNASLSPHRVFEARFWNFADVRAIKDAVEGATVNDVALALVGGALRHYLTEHDELPDTSLVAVCPISIRTPDQVGHGGNQLWFMRQGLGTDEADALSRLKLIAAATAKERAKHNPVGARSLLQVAEVLPGALIGVGARALPRISSMGPTIANTIVTNVPGSPVPLYFCGAQMLRSTGNGPIVHGMGLMHLVSSYAGGFSCAITADRALLPDPAFYADCLERSFQELRSATSSSKGTRPRTSSHARKRKPAS